MHDLLDCAGYKQLGLCESSYEVNGEYPVIRRYVSGPGTWVKKGEEPEEGDFNRALNPTYDWGVLWQGGIYLEGVKHREPAEKGTYYIDPVVKMYKNITEDNLRSKTARTLLFWKHGPKGISAIKKLGHECLDRRESENKT